MIEIALCLAIIGFALVAIIGVLPTGLNVQRDNREETLINQDAVVWMNSIRSGAQGFNDLTNYVIAITNNWTTYIVTPTSTNLNSGIDGYDRTGSRVTSVGTVPPSFALTNGLRIIGLLSTPTFLPPAPPPGGSGTFQSNYMVAYVRALSGSAVEKAPQNNAAVLDNAFTYKMIVQNTPYVPIDPVQLANRAVQILQTNSRDLRLTFRWPLLPNGEVGNSRQTFRAFTGGWLFPDKDPIFTGQKLFFFQPSTYVQIP